jgi:hypothetical protein
MLGSEPARVRWLASRRGAGDGTVKHPHAEEDAMRVGTLWRVAVLASLALLVSGQLCMLTTCVPRLTSSHAAAHACCRALPAGGATGPARAADVPRAMPCSLAMHTAGAPALSLPLASVGPVPLHFAAFAALLAPPPRVHVPRAPIDTGPPVDRHRSAPADLRAPPQA